MIFMFFAVGWMLTSTFQVAAAEGGSDRVEVFGGAPEDRWVFGAELYLWGAGLGGKTTTGDDIDISFSEIVKNLNLGAMVDLVAAKGKWTLFTDLIYLDLSHDDRTTANIVDVPLQVKAKAELKGFVPTLGAAYSVLETESTRLNLLAGARYLWLDGSLKLNVSDLVQRKVSDSMGNWDGIIGLRGKTDLTDTWYLTYFADVGTGDSELTWQALAAINYRFRRVDAVLGYRYLSYDFDDNKVFDNLNLSGPFAGVKFLF